MALLVGELRRGGYELTFERVDTGAGMTAALDKNQWDLVIRDYSMPHTEFAHDFNNALGVILGWAQLGYDNVPDNRPVRENFRMIRDQAQRSAGLTRQLANRGAYKGRNLLSAAKRSGMPTISSIPSRALLGQNPWLPLSCSGPTGSCGRLIVEFRRNRAAGITAISEHALPAVGPLVACTLWTRFSKEQPRHRLLRPRRDLVAPGTRPLRLRLPACVDK
ncbi:MAG: hypothetical protein DMG72_20345 [Acidobacteria bacterium]|nr:MAG: hypothetical protein DMG72_20345 [Acidobacteriota bacterium]